MKKIAIVLGTRPEAIKLLPVYFALERSKVLMPVLVSTGQHKEMLQQIFDFFEVVPNIELQVMTSNQSLAQLTSRLFSALGNYLENENLQAIVVQGDTTTAMVAAMIGFYYKIKVVHVEAGLRTYNNYSPFPEEVNRKVISVVGNIHFTPTGRASEALRKEMINGVFMVGNTVVDSLLMGKAKVDLQLDVYKKHFEKVFDLNKKLILITGHRRESFGQGFHEICAALASLATEFPDFEFVYPVHLNPNVQEVVHQSLGLIRNIYLIAPQPYDKLIFLMSNAYIILTDSGGIQEEAPSLNKPLIVMRDTTERPEGIEAGCAVLAGASRISIEKEFKKICRDERVYKKMTSILNPYGDGRSSERIREILEKELS